uniref:Uncharacterized protein n=1 Tax=Magallana gigas TaxID=29159 RepID=A0A8W8KRP3_MAGGI
MCAAMVDRNPEYPDYGRPMYDSNPQNDYGRPAYESYQQPGDYRRGQEYGQERYNPTSQYPGSSDPPVKEEQANRHRDEMVRQQHASPPHPANQTEMYDHNQMSQQLREERRKEYNDYLRVTSPPHQANIGHDDYGAFRRQTEHEVRNKEYNDFLAKKQHLEDEKKQKLADQRRQAPAPIVKGDYYDSEQYDRRRQALNDLQHREYQNYLKNKGFNQHQPPETNRRPELGLKSEFQDQEPAGRQSQRNAPVGSLIAGDRVDYPSSANERFNRERRKDYNDYIKPQDLKNIHRKREEAIAKIESDGIDMDKVRIFPQGEYVEKQKQLQEEWRKNFRDFAAKKYEIVKKDLQERERVLASYNQKEIDNPTILPAGEYKEKQKHLQQQWRDECRDYYLGKQEADRFRKQENTRPDNRIGFMTHLGRPVEEMREKLAKERHEEYNKYLKDDNWQKEAAGSRSRPTSDKPIHTPTYEEMLDKKRREEASYRRFDDPEYSRSGADRGYDAQYRRYDQ